VQSTVGRWLGPSCAPLQLVDIRESGAQAGIAVCGNGVLIDALRLDGARLGTDDLLGSCDDSFSVRTTEVARESTDGPLRIEGSRIFVDLGDSELVLEFAGDQLLANDGARIWASEGLWSRVIWSADGELRSLRDRTSADVWAPSILQDASQNWN
jgi:hypothetical protein